MQRLAELVRRSALDGSAQLAATVVRHIEALYLHPDLRSDPGELAAYCRLACHWRHLAALRGGVTVARTA